MLLITVSCGTFANVDKPGKPKKVKVVKKPNITWWVFVQGMCSYGSGEIATPCLLCYEVTLSSTGQLNYIKSNNCPMGTIVVNRGTASAELVQGSPEAERIIKQSACDYFATFPEGSRPDCTTLHF